MSPARIDVKDKNLSVVLLAKVSSIESVNKKSKRKEAKTRKCGSGPDASRHVPVAPNGDDWSRYASYSRASVTCL